MITLYDSTETSFTSNGLGSLTDAISCKVTEERNAKFELEMEYPRTGRHWSDLARHKIIFCKPDPYRDPQAFEIYKITNNINKKSKIYAQHISYRLSTIPVAPFEAATCVQALAGLKANAVEPCPFDFTTDKDISSPYVQLVPASIRQRLGGDDDSILEKYKGEYEWDNFNVRLWTNRGQNRGVTIRYGKNMTDFSQEESIENTYTGIYPYWTGMVGENNDIPLTIELTEKVLYSENASLYPRHLTVPLDLSDKFDEPPTEEALRAEAEDWMERNEIGVPEVSMDVSFIALRQTEEYKQVAPLERVSLCDTVTVIFEELNVSATAKVVKTVYDVLKDRYDSIEIGDPKSSLGATIVAQEKAQTTALETTAASITAHYNDKIQQATTILKGGLGGHVIFSSGVNPDNGIPIIDPYGDPNEIYIMDTDNMLTANRILRINVNGIGFSTTGIGGPYSSAWLLDGTFDVGEINVRNLTGNEIIGGIIHDINNRNWWNLQTGEMSINASSGQIAGSNIETENTTEGVRDDVGAILQHFHIRDDAGLEITTDDGTAIILSNGEVLIMNGMDDLFELEDGSLFEFEDGDNLEIKSRYVATDISGKNITTGSVSMSEFMEVGNHKWLARSNGTNTTLVYVGD